MKGRGTNEDKFYVANIIIIFCLIFLTNTGTTAIANSEEEIPKINTGLCLICWQQIIILNLGTAVG
jgi:hypothetical protein